MRDHWKLKQKYIPKQYRDVHIDTTSMGHDNFEAVFKSGGANTPFTRLSMTPIKGDHQGWSSPPDIFQVMLPNGVRLLTTWSRNQTLMEKAIAHINPKNGVVTLLSDSTLDQFSNKTLSEIFKARVHVNSTKYTFQPHRIGDYAWTPGLQFKFNGETGGITALNALPDYRVKTDVRTSRIVHKELREIQDLVEGKADLLRDIHGVDSWADWRSNDNVKKRVLEITGNQRLADHFAYVGVTQSRITDKTRLLNTHGMTPSEGKSLKIQEKSFAGDLYNAIGGSMTHELLSLLLTGHATPNALKLAPLFIAARGGYTLTEMKGK